MTSHHANGRLRFYLVIGLILLAGLPVRADDLRVLPETSPRASSRLYQALLKQAEAAIDRRTQTWSQIQTLRKPAPGRKSAVSYSCASSAPFPSERPSTAV